MDEPIDESRKRAWFELYTEQFSSNSVRSPAEGGPYRCPCCHCLTLETRGDFDICDVCYWEDDGQDNHDADVVRGGPNGVLSLAQARVNYLEFGACERSMIENVRLPFDHEVPR